ncbi:MAG: hypothetical protein EB141_00935 [Verrucomicrobia bacterium]|nr:hypothetical protein [Pseudomonadota bacterium]NDA65391.1 hypothetical protein [Verrucomicrobiota bacterium]NBV24127.1 hypothetical protein [Pseudomonadota bacterium]NDB74208.1 hypothetical protein [Verrucomicrobiota bacterium]NDD36793.1 hypothetical protein [Verrucomicrobiota bacterium]
MADYTYRAKPTSEKLDANYGAGNWTIKKVGKKKNTRWVVTPKVKAPTEPSLGGTTAADDDPLGIKSALTQFNNRQDAYQKKHQDWAGDVRKWSEASLGTLYNAREAANNAYVERLRGIGAPVAGANAPVVGSTTGATPVADPNAAGTNALNQNAAAQAKANLGLAALRGNQDNQNQLDYVANQLKGFDYYAAQIPAIYNESKTKYENSLTSAVLDLQAKKEIAQVGADARTYAAEQNLIASLAATQGKNSTALINAISGIQQTESRNATNVQVAGINAKSRQAISQASINAAWNRQTRTLQAQAQKARQNGTQAKFFQTTWQSFLKGVPVKDPTTGVDSFNQPGSVPPAMSLLQDPAKAPAAAARWLQIAKNQLGMSKKQAAAYILPYLGNNAQAAKILTQAGRAIGW